jgi:hypothetical protein
MVGSAFGMESIQVTIRVLFGFIGKRTEQEDGVNTQKVAAMESGLALNITFWTGVIMENGSSTRDYPEPECKI